MYTVDGDMQLLSGNIAKPFNDDMNPISSQIVPLHHILYIGKKCSMQPANYNTYPKLTSFCK